MGYDSLRNDTKIGGFYFRWIGPLMMILIYFQTGKLFFLNIIRYCYFVTLCCHIAVENSEGQRFGYTQFYV